MLHALREFPCPQVVLGLVGRQVGELATLSLINACLERGSHLGRELVPLHGGLRAGAWAHAYKCSCTPGDRHAAPFSPNGAPCRGP